MHGLKADCKTCGVIWHGIGQLPWVELPRLVLFLLPIGLESSSHAICCGRDQGRFLDRKSSSLFPLSPNVENSSHMKTNGPLRHASAAAQTWVCETSYSGQVSFGLQHDWRKRFPHPRQQVPNGLASNGSTF